MALWEFFGACLACVGVVLVGTLATFNLMGEW